jgi:Zn-dependent protease with chaperone function
VDAVARVGDDRREDSIAIRAVGGGSDVELGEAGEGHGAMADGGYHSSKHEGVSDPGDLAARAEEAARKAEKAARRAAKAAKAARAADQAAQAAAAAEAAGATPPEHPAQPPARARVVLTGISSRAWEHPADRGALTALRELKGFDDVLKAIAGMWNERAWRLQFLGGAIKVDHRQYPRVHRLYAEAAASLDVADLPELYVQNDRNLNAMAVGMATPFIVVNSGMLELADDDELRCLLGHELGHVLSGHAVYRTMIIIMTNLMLRLAWFAIGAIVLYGILAALLEWWRKAELSADRAGLLACQDPAASLRLSMKLAGGGDLSEVDTAAFLEQASEYERSGDIRDSVLKLMLTVFRSHPMPVARAAEIQRWIDSGAYQRILDGDYARRDADADASMSESVKEAADAYRQSFARSEDPLFKLLRKLGAGADGVGEWVGAGAGKVRDWMAAAGRTARDTAAGSRGADEPGSGRG